MNKSQFIALLTIARSFSPTDQEEGANYQKFEEQKNEHTTTQKTSKDEEIENYEIKNNENHEPSTPKQSKKKEIAAIPPVTPKEKEQIIKNLLVAFWDKEEGVTTEETIEKAFKKIKNPYCTQKEWIDLLEEHEKHCNKNLKNIKGNLCNNLSQLKQAQIEKIIKKINADISDSIVKLTILYNSSDLKTHTKEEEDLFQQITHNQASPEILQTNIKTLELLLKSKQNTLKLLLNENQNTLEKITTLKKKDMLNQQHITAMQNQITAKQNQITAMQNQIQELTTKHKALEKINQNLYESMNQHKRSRTPEETPQLKHFKTEKYRNPEHTKPSK